MSSVLRSVILASAAAFGVIVATVAGAAEPAHPDLSGTWDIDQVASDSIDALLAVQGASRLERSMAARAKVVQTIDHHGDVLDIIVDSGSRTGTEHLVLDGEPRPATTPKGEAIVVRAFWGDDGATVVSIAAVSLKDGRKGELEVRRRLGGTRDTLLQTVILRPQGDVAVSAERVFRRRSGTTS